MEDETEELQMNSTEHTWVIDNFSQQTNQICSTKFYPRICRYGRYFSMSIIPTQTDIEVNILYGCSHNGAEMKLKCILSILKANGEKCKTTEIQKDVIQKEYIHYNPSPNYIICKLISRSDLMNPSMNYLPIDKFSIHCEIFYSFNLATTTESKKNFEGLFKTSESSIISNYGNLLSNGTFSDVIFVVGEKEFRAHKSILSAQSPVFLAMFEHDTKENQESQVEINDINPQVMEYLLMYIYTGKIKLMDYCAIDLLVAADKYQIENLRSICEQVLRSNLPDNNLNRIARLADMHNCKNLRNDALAKIQTKTIGSIQGMKNNLEFILEISEKIEKIKLSHTKPN